MSRPQSPPSPVHPAPNEEIKPGSLPTTQLQNDDLDLNPDLYDDTNDQPSLTTEDKQDEANYDTVMSQVSQSHEFDKVDLQNLQQITLPFNEGFQLFKSSFESYPSTSPISSDQKSKFINYIDDQLLQIQRKFIKQQSTNEVIYPFGVLIQNLDAIFDIIWISICHKQRLFGQEEYYIKIMGDLEDYVAHYSTTTTTIFEETWQLNSQNEPIMQVDFTKIVAVCKFLQKLDLQLSLLIDGYAEDNDDQGGKTQRLNETQKVRLNMLVQRLRLRIIEGFEKVALSAQRNGLRDVLEVEATRIFEGVLERLL
ncbi:hypothetical protein CANMA_001399 [Candida margitis]|uniref:uncharacterized protein n=1 Tax=Candida margitis TaxID=1775924 RepID=UPI002227488B|nr:uncharacterized protein CANMA_001399 [Candida margitis]KAI5969549.1 hypothetical protein CANMA_001399 [Candida margitis]